LKSEHSGLISGSSNHCMALARDGRDSAAMKGTDRAYAKINISLDIISKMDDGYHDMLMVMQSITLCDEITIECAPGNGVSVDTDVPYIPGDERNIAAMAALAFYDFTGINGYSTRIAISKSIPVGAGLGGGSADGACVLRILNEMFNTRLQRSELETLGSRVGSDVPFCINGGTVLAKGRGDLMTDLTPIPECRIVICKPPFAFSTPELFGLINCEKIRARPDTAGIIDFLDRGDLSGVARRMYNVFEDVLPRGKKEIENIKYLLLDTGALGAVLTGTGSAVFGIYDSAGAAKQAYDRLSASYSDCYLCETIASCAG